MGWLQWGTLAFAVAFFAGWIYIAYQIKPTKDEENSISDSK